MADKDYKAFIVEGEAREPLIIDNISRVFFAHEDFKIITLPAGQNIYMLWKKMQEDDFETDIIEVLRENHETVAKQLQGINRDDFSEIYLFFDYDGHQKNLGAAESDDVVSRMLMNFDNETENGKLYISYPMVEALRDFAKGMCGNRDSCFIEIEQFSAYKTVSAIRATYPQFDKYNFSTWQDVMDVFSMRLSCLLNQSDTISYEQYANTINPVEIFKLETMETQKNKVFVLSAFPEFLLDYFGERLWRKCVRHDNNQLEECECKN